MAKKIKSVFYIEKIPGNVLRGWFEANEELRTYIKHAPVSYSQSLDISEPRPYRSVPLSEL